MLNAYGVFFAWLVSRWYNTVHRGYDEHQGGPNDLQPSNRAGRNQQVELQELEGGVQENSGLDKSQELVDMRKQLDERQSQRTDRFTQTNSPKQGENTEAQSLSTQKEKTGRKREERGQELKVANRNNHYLRASFKALKTELEETKKECQELSRKNAVTDANIKAMSQGLDFRATREIAGRSHDHYQDRLNGVQIRIRSLVRSSFQPRPMPTVFDIAWKDFPMLTAQVAAISHPTLTDSCRSLRISATDMLQSVLAHIVYEHILADPFFGCSPAFHDDVKTEVFIRMAEVNGRAARSWEASCIREYHSKPSFGQYFSSIEERNAIAKDNCDTTSGNILSLIKPLYDHYGQELPSWHYVFGLVNDAAALSSEFARLDSGLKVLSWPALAKASSNVLSYWTEQRENRDSQTEAASGPRQPIATVLYPGLLKLGRDNGSNWEGWSVWNKAKVEVFTAKHVDALGLQTLEEQQDEEDRSAEDSGDSDDTVNSEDSVITEIRAPLGQPGGHDSPGRPSEDQANHSQQVGVQLTTEQANQVTSVPKTYACALRNAKAEKEGRDGRDGSLLL